MVSAMPSCLCRGCTQEFNLAQAACVKMGMQQDQHLLFMEHERILQFHWLFAYIGTVRMCALEKCLSSDWLQQAEIAICSANRYLWKLRLKTVSDTA